MTQEITKLILMREKVKQERYKQLIVEKSDKTMKIVIKIS